MRVILSKQRCLLFLLLGCITTGILFGTGCTAEKAEKEGKGIAIHFFYNQPCAACDGTEEFRKIFAKELGDTAEQYDYQLLTYNTFRQTERQTRDKMLKEIGYDIEQVGLKSDNLMIIDKKLYVGMQEIEEKLRSAFLDAAEACR